MYFHYLLPFRSPDRSFSSRGLGLSCRVSGSASVWSLLTLDLSLLLFLESLSHRGNIGIIINNTKSHLGASLSLRRQCTVRGAPSALSTLSAQRTIDKILSND